jgi:hypothetical protein
LKKWTIKNVKGKRGQHLNIAAIPLISLALPILYLNALNISKYLKKRFLLNMASHEFDSLDFSRKTKFCKILIMKYMENLEIWCKNKVKILKCH